MDLITCLWFNGNAREAATFYTSHFPDSELSTNWLAPSDTPGNRQGEEVVVNFKIFGRPFIGLNGGPQFPHSEAVSFQIPCADQAEIDHYWDHWLMSSRSKNCLSIAESQWSSPPLRPCFCLRGAEPSPPQRHRQGRTQTRSISGVTGRSL